MDSGVAMDSAAPGNEKGHGSVSLKHLRSGVYEDNWKPPKMHKPAEVDFSFKENEGFYGFGRSNLWPSAAEDGQKMLSFSSSDHQQYGSGIGGVRFRSSFTPSQWMELEHQALIYKHFVSNVPVPPNLLLPIRRSLYSNGSFRSYNSNLLGWGPLHLGFSGSSDPEQGRCRRTDGKKWRCSRDAVPDQKYCEKHINRGRHRSRKPVEGQSGHAVSGSTGAKVPPVAPPLGSSPSAVVMSSGSASSSLDAIKNQFASSTDHLVGRSQGFQGLSLIPPAESFKSKDAHMLYEETPQLEFGIVCSDSFLNSSERISDPFITFDGKNPDSNSVHHFIDNWPKNQPSEELKSDWTQLSMSIPMAPDFSTSPARKSPISSLGPDHEAYPIQMSLGVSHDKGKDIEKQPSWLPVSWGNPLGEVLTSTAAAAEAGKSFFSSQRGLKISSQTGSSPTDVLQKTTFVSLSNCSSPISSENEKPSEKGQICSNLLGSTFMRY